MCLILLFFTCSDYSGWFAKVSLPVQRAPLWSASWSPVLDKSRGSKAAEVQRVWDIYDDGLQFMSRDEALNLMVLWIMGMSLELGWSGPLR